MPRSKLLITFLGVAVTATVLLSQSINAKSYQPLEENTYIFTRVHTYTYRVGNRVYTRVVPTYPFDPYNRNPFVNPTQYGFGPQAMKNFMGWKIPPTKIHSFDYYNKPKPSKMIKYGKWPDPRKPQTPTPTGTGGSQNAPHTDNLTDTAWRYCGAGDAFFVSGKYEEALESYQSAQQRKPGMPEVWVRKAICFFAMGEYTRAVDCIQGGVEQNPSWKLSDYTAFDNMYGKDNPELKAHMDRFRQELKSNPKDPTMNYLAGTILALQGHKVSAKTYFNKSIAVNKTWKFYIAPFQD